MAAANDSDFIDIDVTSSSSSTSKSQSSEFEFQISSVSVEKIPIVSPADELFFNGKLLPLHLPPRLQMLQTLLKETCEDCSSSIQLFSNSTDNNGYSNTPAESSPSDSCRVSCELNPSEFLFQWSTDYEFGSYIHSHHHHWNPKKTWCKKLKLMKQSSLLTQKLKGLFIKSANSNEPTCKSAAKQQFNKLNRLITMKIPFGPFSHVESNSDDNIVVQPRRSFSEAIKRHSPSKCLSSSSSTDSSCSGASSLSSSFSVNSNALFKLHFFKKSNSDTSEIETSIQAAIAHCKNS